MVEKKLNKMTEEEFRFRRYNKKLVRELKVLKNWLKVELSRNFMASNFDSFIYSHLEVCNKFKNEIDKLLEEK